MTIKEEMRNNEISIWTNGFYWGVATALITFILAYCFSFWVFT